jgi:hypothetical protein
LFSSFDRFQQELAIEHKTSKALTRMKESTTYQEKTEELN